MTNKEMLKDFKDFRQVLKKSRERLEELKKKKRRLFISQLIGLILMVGVFSVYLYFN